MTIISKNNPLVKELASLKEKRGRRERGTFLVEGVKMAHECVRCGMDIRRVVLREDYEGERYPFEEVVLGRGAFDFVCDAKTPQGIALEVAIPSFPLRAPEEPCLLLDGVQDPANMGAIIRTALAAGYKKLYCIDCADPYSPKSVRSSMSGVFFVEIMQGSREEVLSALRGVPVVAADMKGESVFKFTPPEIFVLAVGNEGQGLSQAVRDSAQYTVKIPMGEQSESLNVAVSAGIVMYELKRNSFLK